MAVILKGCAYCFALSEVRGGGSRNEECRQQPPAINYYVRTCSLQSTPHLLCVYHTWYIMLLLRRKNSHIKWPTHIPGIYIYTPEYVTFVDITDCESSTWPISTNPGCMKAGEYGLTRRTCLSRVVSRWSGSLGCCEFRGVFWLGGIFSCFFSFLLFLATNESCRNYGAGLPYLPLYS